MIFDNGCKIDILSSAKLLSISTTIDYFFVMDYAHIPPIVADQIFPCISTNNNSKAFIQSSPNGINHFYNLFMSAERGVSAFKSNRVYWWQVPGHDDEWRKQIIAQIGLDVFLREYELCFKIT